MAACRGGTGAALRGLGQASELAGHTPGPSPGGLHPAPASGSTRRGRAAPSLPARPWNPSEDWEGALQIISIQRLPWAGDPAMLTHGNADMSQLGEKTPPFPFSLSSIPSSLGFSPGFSAPPPPHGQGNSSQSRDGAGLFIPGENGNSQQMGAFISLRALPAPPSLFLFPPDTFIHLSREFQPTLGFLSPQQQLSPSLRFAGMLNLTSYCSCIFLLRSPGSVWQEQPALLVPSWNPRLGDEIGMLGSAWAQGCWLLIAIYCPARLLCQLRISAARLGIYFQPTDEKVAQAGAALLLGSTSTIQQEHSRVGLGVQGTCQELPGHCGVSWLPVGLEMPRGTGGAPRVVCPARPVRQHRRRVGQGAGTGNCPE